MGEKIMSYLEHDSLWESYTDMFKKLVKDMIG